MSRHDAKGKNRGPGRGTRTHVTVPGISTFRSCKISVQSWPLSVSNCYLFVRGRIALRSRRGRQDHRRENGAVRMKVGEVV